GLQRRREGEIAFDALGHRVLGLADLVRDELERIELAGVGDREHPGEDLLQAFVAAPGGIGFHLEKITEALELDLEQVRNLEIPLRVDLREALALLTTCRLQCLTTFP